MRERRSPQEHPYSDEGGKMAAIVRSIEISRRPNEVFSYATDFSRLPNEIVAVMRRAPDDRHGWRVRAILGGWPRPGRPPRAMLGAKPAGDGRAAALALAQRLGLMGSSLRLVC
jgi:hypothetical protein